MRMVASQSSRAPGGRPRSLRRSRRAREQAESPGTLGTPVTAFASIINAGTVAATKCSIQLPAGVQANFKYQTTDPATNVPTGTANTPVDIAAGATKTFYFAITPTAFFSQDIPLVFVCDNTDPAPSIPGLNTFLLTVTNPAISDMLMITDTPSHDGFITVPGTAGHRADGGCGDKSRDERYRHLHAAGYAVRTGGAQSAARAQHLSDQSGDWGLLSYTCHRP